MPTALVPASYLVRRTQELAQAFGTQLQFRPGFTDDPSPGASQTPILPGLNEYVASLVPLGFYQLTLGLTLVIGTAEYSIDAQATDVYSAYYNGVPLRRTTREAINTYNVLWGTVSGIPTQYIAEGGTITLMPIPDATATGVLTYRAACQPTPVLAAETDTITGMRNSWAYRLPYGAANILVTIDDKNAAHVERRKLYSSVAEALVAEMKACLKKVDDYTPVSMDDFDFTTVVQSGRDDASGAPQGR